MSIDPREAAIGAINAGHYERAKDILYALLAVPSPSPSFTEAYELGREQGRKETSPAVPSDIREALEKAAIHLWTKFHISPIQYEREASSWPEAKSYKYSATPPYEAAASVVAAALTSSPPGDGKLREALEAAAKVCERRASRHAEDRKRIEATSGHDPRMIDACIAAEDEGNEAADEIRALAALSVRDAGDGK